VEREASVDPVATEGGVLGDAEPMPMDSGGLAADDAEVPGDGSGAADRPYRGPRFLLIVVEGLRPEMVSDTWTPNIARVARDGVVFGDHYSSFPSNSFAAAASLATGREVAGHGIYGERMFEPGVQGRDSSGRPFAPSGPFELSDYAVMQAVASHREGKLFGGDSIFDVARAQGAALAFVGHSGPLTSFDYALADLHVDEHVASPYALADELARLSIDEDVGDLVATLPPKTSVLFSEFESSESPFTQLSPGSKTLVPKPAWPDIDPPRVVAGPPRGDVLGGIVGVGAVDPARVLNVSLQQAGDQYFGVAARTIARKFAPDFAVYWVREPALGMRRYGANSESTFKMLLEADRAVGRALSTLGSDADVNVIITSDHGFSTVGGAREHFERYMLSFPTFSEQISTNTYLDVVTGMNVVQQVSTFTPDPNTVVRTDEPTGISLDGEVRLAWLLQRAGFVHAFDVAGSSPRNDGQGCLTSTLARELLKAQEVPATVCLPFGAEEAQKPRKDTIIVASNEASEHLYMPRAEPDFVAKVVRVLQGRPELGAIFVASRHGNVPGTLSMAEVGLEFARGPTPDVIAVYASDDADVVNVTHTIDVRPPPFGVAWFQSCQVDPCRSGLWCAPSKTDPSNANVLAEYRCLYCPEVPDDPGLSAEENLLAEQRAWTCRFANPSSAVDLWKRNAAQRTASTKPVPSGQFCETFGLCESGNECVLFDAENPVRGGVCAESGSPVPVSDPSSGRVQFSGTSYASMRNARGVSGGLGAADLRAVLIARGPDFAAQRRVDVPSGIVDIAPTLAHLMGAELAHTTGRVLYEALRDADGADAAKAVVGEETLRGEPTEPLPVYSPQSPLRDTPQRLYAARYHAFLRVKTVRVGDREHRYVVGGGATRER
jgi:hypothetical protein